MIGRPAVGEVAPGVYRFRPPIWTVARSLAAVPFAAAAFGCLAWLVATRGLGAGRMPWLQAAPLVLAGAVVVGGTLVVARGGVRRTVFEVAPDGIWSRGSGRLPWHAIAEVRLELMRDLVDGMAIGKRGYLRLAVVPKDVPLPAIQRSRRAMSAFQSSSNAFVQRLVPSARMGPLDRAPFGVADYEIRESLADVAAAVRRYAPVVDAAERWALARAARDPEARPRSGDPPVTPTDPDARPRHVTFLRPPLGVAVTQTMLAPGAFILGGIIVAWLMPPRAASGAPSWIGVVFVAVGAVAIAVGLWMLRPLVEQVRRSFQPPESLDVGPDGIWTQELRRLVPWADVEQVRAERAGMARVWCGKAEAWRVVVVPGAVSGGGGVRSDEIDAPFDDVLDLIRRYHPVDEVG